MSGILRTEVLGEERLVAKACIVDKGDTGDPVAGIELTLLVEHIVLTPHEVPHEITHVHVDQLVVEEIGKVLRVGGSIAHLLRISDHT